MDRYTGDLDGAVRFIIEIAMIAAADGKEDSRNLVDSIGNWYCQL
jgi:hypothetical protein